MRMPFIVLTASLLASTAVHANLIVNGSFETVDNPSPGFYLQISTSPPNPFPLALCECLTGWEIVGNGVEWIHPSSHPILGNAADGFHYIDLTLWANIGAGVAGIKQDFSTIVGQSYTLTFFAATSTGYGRYGTGQFVVNVAGISQTFDLNNPAALLNWMEYQVDFEAIDTVTTIQFTTNQDENFHFSIIDNVDVVESGPSTQVVQIDVKPGSDPNSINLCSNGAVPVAILGSNTLDVYDVNTETLRFADAAVKVVGKKDPHSLCSIEDVNGDFVDDVVCHYVTTDIAGVDGESTSATVNGELLGGTPIEGTDSVNIVKDTCN